MNFRRLLGIGRLEVPLQLSIIPCKFLTTVERLVVARKARAALGGFAIQILCFSVSKIEMAIIFPLAQPVNTL